MYPVMGQISFNANMQSLALQPSLDLKVMVCVRNIHWYVSDKLLYVTSHAVQDKNRKHYSLNVLVIYLIKFCKAFADAICFIHFTDLAAVDYIFNGSTTTMFNHVAMVD